MSHGTYRPGKKLLQAMQGLANQDNIASSVTTATATAATAADAAVDAATAAAAAAAADAATATAADAYAAKKKSLSAMCIIVRKYISWEQIKKEKKLNK